MPQPPSKDYPRMMFSPHGWVIVNSEEEEAALGSEWSRKVYTGALETEREPLPKPQPPAPEEEEYEEEEEKPDEQPQEHHKKTHTPITKAPPVKKRKPAAHAGKHGRA